MKFGILDFPTESSVETEVLGPGAQITCYGASHERDLPDDIAELIAVMVWHNIYVSAQTLHRLDQCRVISRIGVGFDSVDYRLAGELGIPVVNVPDYGTNEVANHAFALLLAANRKLNLYQDRIRQDPAANWRPTAVGEIHRLRNAVLGIVGLGRIGTAVAMRARAFGMRVAYYDPYLPDGYDKAYQVQRVETLEELVGMSDFLSVHAPLTSETDGLVDAALLAHAKPGMTLVNTARGPIVALDAVYESLKRGHLGVFAADVLPGETPDPNHPLIVAYTERESWLDGRLLLTPHAAFYSVESFREMRTKAALQMKRAAEGIPLRNCVNAAYLKNPRTPVALASPPD